MSVTRSLQQWWQETTGEEETPFDGDVLSFFASLAVHVGIVVALAYTVLPQPESKTEFVLVAPPTIDPIDELVLPPEEFAVSDEATEKVGAGSEHGDAMAMSIAPMIDEVADIPNPVDTDAAINPEFEVNNILDDTTALSLDKMLAVKGTNGVGTTGAEGAVDRLTHEILQLLEHDKTLVVWLFDQSPSMIKQRATVNARFERIYRELGVIEAAGSTVFKRHEDHPLLTQVIAFGKDFKFMLKEPTANLAEIQEAVEKIPADDSGDEMTFSAVLAAAKKYESYRRAGERDKRNVMLVVFSDEIGSDVVERDARGVVVRNNLDVAVKTCRRLEMPVYVVGVPAPFGQRETQVKWVDPDPKFDQTPQWGVVEQGPETLFPETLRVSGRMSAEESDPIDSGFGPYALTRLCYETGGIYFSVHPNRRTGEVRKREVEAFASHLKYFYDPDAMRRYKPDYLTYDETVKRLQDNACRTALVKAANMSHAGELENPQLRFEKRDEGQFTEALSRAQRAAAILEPRLEMLFNELKVGEAAREKEISPRWQAGFDLAYGQVLAAKCRVETYNAMLAAAKRGLKPKDPKTNVWILEPANEVSVGSALSQQAEKARKYLQRTIDNHPGTPWAHLAAKELSEPLAWKWTEDFIPPPPPPPKMAPAPAANPPPVPARPRDEEALKIAPPPKRPPPKKL